MFRIGAITDEICDHIEDALALMSSWNMTEVEVHTLWGSSIERVTDDQVSRLKTLLDRHGLHLCMVSSTVFLRCRLSPGPLPEPWDRRFDTIGGTYSDHLAALSRCVEIAVTLRSPMIRIFGFWSEQDHSAASLKVVAARLSEAIEIVASRGIVLALENCPHTQLELTRNALDVIRAVRSPWLRLLWDPSNAWRSGERDLLDLVELVLPYLAHMHIKGIRLPREGTARPTYVPLDEGDVDYAALLGKLSQAGYAGVISLEPHYARPRSGREGAARESFDRLSGLMRRIKAADGAAITTDPPQAE